MTTLLVSDTSIPRPGNRSFEVAMREQLWCRRTQRDADQRYLKPGPAGILHGGNAIGVVGHQDRVVPHVFVPEIGNDVVPPN